ncbi:hypothetical protein B0H13DRAFT_2530158 [Mycena leptocephala]|nr:hypothetical protein B0H13DRAFT_2530158 [Mycena leptocephala]
MTHSTSVPSVETPHPYTTARCHPATRRICAFTPTHQPRPAPKQAAHKLVPHDSESARRAISRYPRPTWQADLAVFHPAALPCIVPSLAHGMILWRPDCDLMCSRSYTENGEIRFRNQDEDTSASRTRPRPPMRRRSRMASPTAAIAARSATHCYRSHALPTSQPLSPVLSNWTLGSGSRQGRTALAPSRAIAERDVLRMPDTPRAGGRPAGERRRGQECGIPMFQATLRTEIYPRSTDISKPQPRWCIPSYLNHGGADPTRSQEPLLGVTLIQALQAAHVGDSQQQQGYEVRILQRGGLAAHSSVAPRPRPRWTRVQRRRLNPLQIIIIQTAAAVRGDSERQRKKRRAATRNMFAFSNGGPEQRTSGSGACVRCAQIAQFAAYTLIDLDSSLIPTTDIGTLLCTTIIRTFSGARRASTQHRHAKERGTGVRVHVLQPRGPELRCRVTTRAHVILAHGAYLRALVLEVYDHTFAYLKPPDIQRPRRRRARGVAQVPRPLRARLLCMYRTEAGALLSLVSQQRAMHADPSSCARFFHRTRQARRTVVPARPTHAAYPPPRGEDDDNNESIVHRVVWRKRVRYRCRAGDPALQEPRARGRMFCACVSQRRAGGSFAFESFRIQMDLASIHGERSRPTYPWGAILWCPHLGLSAREGETALGSMRRLSSPLAPHFTSPTELAHLNGSLRSSARSHPILNRLYLRSKMTDQQRGHPSVRRRSIIGVFSSCTRSCDLRWRKGSSRVLGTGGVRDSLYFGLALLVWFGCAAWRIEGAKGAVDEARVAALMDEIQRTMLMG